MRKTVVLLLMVAWLCGCGESKQKEVKAPTRVKTQLVSAVRGGSHLQCVGIVEESEATAVSFTGMGVVRRVLVNEGQAVARGQLLAVMDDTQARNVLAGAQAQMTQANDALERYRMLHEAGSLPEVQWVEIQSKVAQAKSQLEVARKNLADCRLTAPVSGIVGQKLVKAGETAMPSQAVVNILNIGTVKVKVAVPEAEIGGISPTTATSISVEAVNAQYVGGRIEKGVQADALTHTYDVRISVANGGRRLLPGMVANVSFATNGGRLAGGKLVPVTAVQKASDGQMFVWAVANDSTAHRVSVSVGGTRGNNIAITNGLTDGQRIVTEGYQKLSEGSRVVF